MRHIILGGIDEIEEGESKAYTLTINNKDVNLFVVRRYGKFYAYKNHCPHTGVTLNWQADQFLDINSQYIQCSTHGALFRIDDGLCEWGPCLGKNLQPLNIRVENEKLILT